MAKKTNAQLEKELSSTKTELEATTEKMLQWAQDIGRLKGDLERKTAEVVPLKNENITLKDRITQKDKRINEMEGEISGLKYAIDMMATGMSS